MAKGDFLISKALSDFDEIAKGLPSALRSGAKVTNPALKARIAANETGKNTSQLMSRAISNVNANRAETRKVRGSLMGRMGLRSGNKQAIKTNRSVRVAQTVQAQGQAAGRAEKLSYLKGV